MTKGRSPEDRWVYVNGLWGVEVVPGMKLKDLPADIKIATVYREGALRPLDYKNGCFVHITWKKSDPFDWPDPTETPISIGDYIVIANDGGIDVVKQSAAIPYSETGHACHEDEIKL